MLVYRGFGLLMAGGNEAVKVELPDKGLVFTGLEHRWQHLLLEPCLVLDFDAVI